MKNRAEQKINKLRPLTTFVIALYVLLLGQFLSSNFIYAGHYQFYVSDSKQDEMRQQQAKQPQGEPLDTGYDNYDSNLKRQLRTRGFPFQTNDYYVIFYGVDSPQSEISGTVKVSPNITAIKYNVACVVSLTVIAGITVILLKRGVARLRERKTT